MEDNPGEGAGAEASRGDGRSPPLRVNDNVGLVLALTLAHLWLDGESGAGLAKC